MSAPSKFIDNLIGQQVIIKLNTGVEYKGKLTCLDGCLNVVLEDSQELVQGKLKAKYGDAFIRGNNITYISPVVKA